MGTSPEQVRAEIEETRARLSRDLDRLAEQVSPRQVAHRRTERMRGAATGVKDRVMGTAAESTGQATERTREVAGHAADRTRGAAGQTGQAVRRVPEQAARQTRGNPLAAGLVAFGAGLLAGTTMRSSRGEQQASVRLADYAGQFAEPAKNAARESTRRMRDEAADTARQSVQEIRNTVTGGGERGGGGASG